MRSYSCSLLVGVALSGLDDLIGSAGPLLGNVLRENGGEVASVASAAGGMQPVGEATGVMALVELYALAMAAVSPSLRQDTIETHGGG